MTSQSGFSLSDLNAIIKARAEAEDDSTSYTVSLLAKGMAKCAEKFGEEAVEAVIAAVTHDREGLVKESADVLYHLLVLLQASEVDLEAVMQELKSRTSQSGLQEKASRNKN